MQRPNPRSDLSFLARAVAGLGLALGGAASAATGPACSAQSGPHLTPVLELYTSEGCSSCPPADRWLSTLKAAAAEGKVIAQAFHVGYWDYIGWVDRFATPAHTTRQRQVAAANNLRSIYTPQLVRNGQDWRDYDKALAGKPEPARASIRIERTAPDAFEALVVPSGAAGGRWTAYWTVTEHGHGSKVKAGENAGEFLQHDFVVRQYVPAGTYDGDQRLVFRPIPEASGHAQRINLVVADAKTGRVWQGLGLQCRPG